MTHRSPALPPLLLLLGTLAALPAGATPDVASGRLAALAARVEARIREPGAAADLYELSDLAPQVENLERLAAVFHSVYTSPRALPEVRALAGKLLSEVNRQRGRVPQMEALLDQLGMVREVAFAGPFDDENGTGLDAVYGPEQDGDLAATHDGLRTEVRWRVVPELGARGPVELYQAVRPNREVVVYVLARLEAPRDVDATLLLGTSGATKVWLDGRPILLDPDSHPARFDQSAVPVRLRRGASMLLLKIGSGLESPPGLYLRVAGANGRAIPGLKVTAPTSGSYPVPRPFPEGARLAPRRPLVEKLERLAAKADVRARLDLARVLGEQRGFDDAEKRHLRTASEVAQAAPHDVDAQLLAASYETEDGNRRREWLERAVAAERPGEARAHAALAAHHLEHDQPRRALDLLDARLKEAPGDVQAALLHARALDAMGLPGRARAGVMALAAEHRVPAVLLEQARWLRRDGEDEAALRALRVALAVNPASASAAGSLASLLVDRGAVEDALQVYEGALRVDPADLGMLLRRADLLAASGRAAEARDVYARAAVLAPQESEVFERAARASLLAGDRAAALASLEQAVRVKPQDSRLKELLQSLEPGSASFARPFLHDLREVTAASSATYEGEDAATLLDLSAIQVLPSGQASRTSQTIVKVFTQRGVDSMRAVPVRYAPDREDVKVERARILKPDGTVVETHGESDRSLTESWSGMWFDARMLVISFPGLAPGDVVELVYRQDDVGRDNLLSDYFGDVSFVQDSYPKERWEYVLEMPRGRPLYFNDPPGAKHEATELPSGAVLHRWTAAGVRKIVPEPRMPGLAEVAAYLHVSTYRDWESVARFWWGLIKEQVAPTPEIERVAREVTQGIPESDVAGRVRAVYDFVATRTRYVGLEFGIHSFKPYKVDKVLSRKFGDCKDKASLVYAMLRSIGIDSRLVLLRMRHLGRIGAEPASLAVFNHAILHVPELDLFLDGTAEWSGSGELPQSDRGAEVLIVNPGGESRFTVTPEASPELSLTASTYAVTLQGDGSAVLGGKSRIGGIPAAGYRRAYASPSARKASFEQAWSRTFPGLTVASLDVSDVLRREEDVSLDFSLSVPRFAAPAEEGGLEFTPFGSSTRYVESYAALSSRRYDLVLDHPWVNRFRYEIALPPGMDVARLPPPVDESSELGSVKLTYEREGRVVVAEGAITIAAARVTPQQYPAFRAFLGKVDRALEAKVILSPAQASR